MGRWIFFLFLVVPAVELMLLIRLGAKIGAPATLLVILLTGIVGATLTRRQGMTVIAKAQAEAARGGLPAGPLLDGLMLLVAGVLLITPGVITDVVGFLLLAPPVRALLRGPLVRTVFRTLQPTVVTHHGGGFGQGGPAGFGGGFDPRGRPAPRDAGQVVIDVEAESVDTDTGR